MSHVFAVLALGAGCILWFLLRRWAGASDEAPCAEHGPDCRACRLGEAGCASARPAGPADRDRPAPAR